MSVSKWAWTEECEGQPCPGDCDLCERVSTGYISKGAFIAAKRKQYCADCDRRKGTKNGVVCFCYEIGEAPCRACGIGDMLDDVDDFPAADVVERNQWISAKEMMPAPDEEVLFYCKWIGASGTTYYETVIYTEKELAHAGFEPIAWMPLPEPPKMDGGESDDD